MLIGWSAAVVIEILRYTGHAPAKRPETHKTSES
jgi:hypothetical protein